MFGSLRASRPNSSIWVLRARVAKEASSHSRLITSGNSDRVLHTRRTPFRLGERVGRAPRSKSTLEINARNQCSKSTLKINDRHPRPNSSLRFIARTRLQLIPQTPTLDLQRRRCINAVSNPICACDLTQSLKKVVVGVGTFPSWVRLDACHPPGPRSYSR